MRHLKTIGVGPSDLIPLNIVYMTALLRKLRSQANPDSPFRCRSLAFPSVADLFDVQSFFNHVFSTIYKLMKFTEICRRPTDRREVTHVKILISKISQHFGSVVQ